MAQTITNNTRTEAVKTVSSHYFFNIGGTFSSNTFALEWSEDGTTWYPIKDSTDDNLTRTAASNGASLLRVQVTLCRFLLSLYNVIPLRI